MTPSSRGWPPPWPLTLAWAAVALTLVGFVLPWARLDVHEPSALRQLRTSSLLNDPGHRLGRIAVTIQRGSHTISGDLPTGASLPTQVSGWQIPRLANAEQAQTAMALVELVTNTRQHLGLKSYAVYLVPGLALLCGIGLMRFRESPVMVGVIGVLCAAVAAAGWWRAVTVNTRTAFVAVTIAQGVWCSLWGYVGLACAAGGLLWMRRRPT